MNSEELKKRTQEFGIRVIKLVDALPNTRTSNNIGNQLMRSATSIGANYRAACRGRSKAEFIAKLGIAIEEADESAYWLEILVNSDLIKEDRVKDLMAEANELTAILTASAKTARKNLK